MSYPNLLQINLVLLLLFSVSCITGLDTSAIYPTSTFQCLKSLGNTFVIVEGLSPVGEVNQRAIQSLTNALNAGMITDLKMSPCRGKSASSQADKMLETIPSNLYDTVWIEVQSNLNPGCEWERFSPT